MATKKKQNKKKPTKKAVAKKPANKSNGASKKPKAVANPAERDEHGLTKTDKANLTRFARDLSNKVIKDHPHLTTTRIRLFLLPKGEVRDAILEHGTMAWAETGFKGKVDAFLKTVTPSSRPRLTPEQKAKRAEERRAALLSVAKGGTPNDYAISALKTAYLQGLEAEARAAAKAKFERAVGA